MTQVLIKHRVKDYEMWKEAFENFADYRKSSGEKSYRVLHPVDDPSDLTLIFEWDTQENAETFLKSEQLRSAMERAGVAEAPQVQFLHQALGGTV